VLNETLTRYPKSIDKEIGRDDGEAAEGMGWNEEA
jgi:hypothetical protein